MKGIAFIKDPDGYWIEIFDLNKIGEVAATASWSINSDTQKGLRIQNAINPCYAVIVISL